MNSLQLYQEEKNKVQKPNRIYYNLIIELDHAFKVSGNISKTETNKFRSL